VTLAGVLDDWLDVTDWPTSRRGPRRRDRQLLRRPRNRSSSSWGGGASAALEELRPGIDEALSLRAAFMAPPPVVRGKLGDLAGAVGAATVARRTAER
jgi:hypothetical protein